MSNYEISLVMSCLLGLSTGLIVFSLWFSRD